VFLNCLEDENSIWLTSAIPGQTQKDQQSFTTKIKSHKIADYIRVTDLSGKRIFGKVELTQKFIKKICLGKYPIESEYEQNEKYKARPELVPDVLILVIDVNNIVDQEVDKKISDIYDAMKPIPRSFIIFNQMDRILRFKGVNLTVDDLKNKDFDLQNYRIELPDDSKHKEEAEILNMLFDNYKSNSFKIWCVNDDWDKKEENIALMMHQARGILFETVITHKPRTNY